MTATTYYRQQFNIPGVGMVTIEVDHPDQLASYRHHYTEAEPVSPVTRVDETPEPHTGGLCITSVVLLDEARPVVPLLTHIPTPTRDWVREAYEHWVETDGTYVPEGGWPQDVEPVGQIVCQFPDENEANEWSWEHMPNAWVDYIGDGIWVVIADEMEVPTPELFAGLRWDDACRKTEMIRKEGINAWTVERPPVAGSQHHTYSVVVPHEDHDIAFMAASEDDDPIPELPENTGLALQAAITEAKPDMWEGLGLNVERLDPHPGETSLFDGGDYETAESIAEFLCEQGFSAVITRTKPGDEWYVTVPNEDVEIAHVALAEIDVRNLPVCPWDDMYSDYTGSIDVVVRYYTEPVQEYNPPTWEDMGFVVLEMENVGHVEEVVETRQCTHGDAVVVDGHNPVTDIDIRDVIGRDLTNNEIAGVLDEIADDMAEETEPPTAEHYQATMAKLEESIRHLSDMIRQNETNRMATDIDSVNRQLDMLAEETIGV